MKKTLEPNSKISTATFNFTYAVEKRRISLCMMISDSSVKLTIRGVIPDKEFYAFTEEVVDAYLGENPEVSSRSDQFCGPRLLIFRNSSKSVEINFRKQEVILSDKKDPQMFWTAVRTFGELCGAF